MNGLPPTSPTHLRPGIGGVVPTTALILSLATTWNPATASPVMFSDNGHYYEVVVTALSWPQARTVSQASMFNGRNGHLATITSQAENSFVASLLSTLGMPAWIGGFQPPGSPEPSGDWQWVTGEPFTYTNWGPGEPNNTNHLNLEEDALMIGWPVNTPQAWNDGVASGGVKGYVVEYDIDLSGDLNSDGFVGIIDLNLILGNWNQTIPPGDPLADPSGDGFVGIVDLNVVLGNWNAGTPPPPGAAVPEPGMLVLLLIGGLAVLRVRPDCPGRTIAN